MVVATIKFVVPLLFASISDCLAHSGSRLDLERLAGRPLVWAKVLDGVLRGPASEHAAAGPRGEEKRHQFHSPGRKQC